MQEVDLHRVLEIESAAYLYPWSKGIFKDCMQAGYCCWVIDEGLLVRAYAIMQVVADEAHVLNLCVDPQYQYRGMGRRLLKQLIQVGAGHFAQVMLLEVRPSNKNAIALYHSEGFTQIGRRRKYYPNHKNSGAGAKENSREDALVLSRALDSDYAAVSPDWPGAV